MEKLNKINNELKNYQEGLEEEMTRVHENKQIGTEELKEIKLNNIKMAS